MRKIFGIALCLLLVACNKKPGAPAEPMVTPTQDPERVILSVELSIPPEHKAKVKKTDVLLWDLKDGSGRLLGSQILPVPSLPYRLQIKARDLVKAVPEKSVLLFASRITHFGDEYKMPAKGQLSALVGVVPSKEAVENPNVDEKRFEKWAKKNQIVADEVLSIGSSAKATLIPSQW